MWTNRDDPVMTCQPLGVPRHGRGLRGGFFHSDQMHVAEKFTREGDEILYDADPALAPSLQTGPALHRNAGPFSFCNQFFTFSRADGACGPRRPSDRDAVRGVEFT